MSEQAIIRVLAVVCILLVGAVCGNCWGSMAYAEGGVVAPEGPREPSSSGAEERAAALVLARYAANEAGLRGRGDLLLIWQVAETHADDLRGRVAWLRRHSRCVVSRRAPDEWPDGACRWTRHLRADGERPEGWPRGPSWSRARVQWLDLLALAVEVVTGREARRPCDGDPQTWDGRRWRAARVAVGYRPVSCSDPWTGRPLHNIAYRFPPLPSR